MPTQIKTRTKQKKETKQGNKIMDKECQAENRIYLGRTPPGEFDKWPTMEMIRCLT